MSEEEVMNNNMDSQDGGSNDRGHLPSVAQRARHAGAPREARQHGDTTAAGDEETSGAGTGGGVDSPDEEDDDDVEFLPHESGPSTSSGRTGTRSRRRGPSPDSVSAPTASKKARRKTSDVWAHYDEHDDPKFAVCKFCNTKVCT